MKFPDEGKSYRCVRCRLERAGRFCNAIRLDAGWSQGSTHVSWYCWRCLPFGHAYRPKEKGEPPDSARLARQQLEHDEGDMSGQQRGATVIDSEAVEVSAQPLGTDVDVDIQVATARRYPRSITSAMRSAQEMATLTPEIAASCIYALPRRENGKQKNIEGPSARFAEILAYAWGNLRAEGKVGDHDGQFVTSRGTSWDVEKNVAIAYEIKRRITTSDGATYSADMIMVTGNAAASIALRNAILKNIPTPFWKPVYQNCRQVVAGDAKTFAVLRDQRLHALAVMGVSEERLYAALGVGGKMDITFDHMVTLAGFYTALKDGDTTIEQAFPEVGLGKGKPQPARRRSEGAEGAGEGQQPAAEPSTGATTQPATTSATPAEQKTSTPANVGTVVDVLASGSSVFVALDSGFLAGTVDPELIAAARAAKGKRVELVTRAPRDAKFKPTILDIKHVGANA